MPPTTRFRPQTFVPGIALVLFACVACGGGGTGPDPSPDLDVVLSPPTVTFDALGQTAQLEVIAYNAEGQAVYRVDAAGTSSDPEVATVDDAGLITAVGQGSARITATAEDVDGEVTVTVDQVVADVSLGDVEISIGIGDTYEVELSTADANGHDVEDATGAWSSSDEDVATVDDLGTVTGIGEGSATIRFDSDDGPSGEAAVTVE